MKDRTNHNQKLWQARTKRIILVMGFMVIMVLVFQNLRMLPKNALSPRFPASDTTDPGKSGLADDGSASTSFRVGKFSLLSDLKNSTNRSVVSKELESSKGHDPIGNNEISESLEEDDDIDDEIDLDEDKDADEEFSFDLGDGVILKKVKDSAGGFIVLQRTVDPKKAPMEMVTQRGSNVLDDDTNPDSDLQMKQIDKPDEVSISSGDDSSSLVSDINRHVDEISEKNSGNSIKNAASTAAFSGKVKTEAVLSSAKQEVQVFAKNETLVAMPVKPALHEILTNETTPSLKKKKKRQLPPVYISEMNLLLDRNRAVYHAMRPRWSSARDKQMLDMKARIENAPIVKNDRELYAPAFRNISMFKRSYELMERTLKVYVYKEGQKPIFHQPLLKGIYASEGWFMKLMEGNRRYVVRDPKKAHLFYIPFSSRLLQFALYEPKSHDRRHMEKCLQDYVDLIAAKYPFWNRTGGADHFVVACHDWAPFETRHTMPRAIRALCNADVHGGFRLGKDVSLPETYVRFGRNPLKDLGGKPANERPTLAFYAGNLHGSFRPVLLQHWENKDPDMKIFGPMPGGVRSKMTYIQHMKTSKYCICPGGYEVNSPRVVEAIFYECVPVMISDDYVPPFFDILNWEAFSVFIPEKDVARLKEILLSIPEERYLALQLGVRKVQQHFLWHSKPVKYDLFHMILHSIWYNRVFQIRTR